MNKKVLVIDDSYFFRHQIKRTLEAEGFSVVLAEDGMTGLELVDKEKPDLVLLDVEMPGISGFDVCRALREEQGNMLIPIIMITSKDALDDKLIGLELGADDYLTKPFNERELISRIRNTVLRTQRNRQANPLTGLPGNIEISREINQRIANEQDFTVVYIDLDNFKAYNDVYGFLRGDTMIKMVADILLKQVKLFGVPQDFTGHIGGDDFLYITVPEKAEPIGNAVIADFDEKVKQLFNEEDLKNGYVQKMNRKGELERYPITTITLAAVHCPPGKFDRDVQVSDTAAEMKVLLKQLDGSNYMQDRRQAGAAQAAKTAKEEKEQASGADS